jgi:hypothetical protein
MNNNKMKLIKFTSGLSRTANIYDNNMSLLDNTGIDLFVSEDKSFIIYEKNRFPLNYIKTVYIGDPYAESTKAPIRLAQRDVSMRIIYRIKERDLTFIYYHDGINYKFSHITFSNREFR